MINFKEYETLTLSDIAEWTRAKEGYVYPKGTTIIQISATTGQVGYLEQPSEVPSKYVVVIPVANVHSYYMYIIIQKNIEKFIAKYKAGLNIQEGEIGNIEIQLHDYETQKAVVKLFRYIEGQREITEEEINSLKNLKELSLSKMFV